MLIKFTSPICQPCKDLNRLIKDNNITLELEEVDVTKNPDIVMQYGIKAVPTLVNVDTGDKVVGIRPIFKYLKELS